MGGYQQGCKGRKLSVGEVRQRLRGLCVLLGCRVMSVMSSRCCGWYGWFFIYLVLQQTYVLSIEEAPFTFTSNIEEWVSTLGMSQRCSRMNIELHKRSNSVFVIYRELCIAGGGKWKVICGRLGRWVMLLLLCNWIFTLRTTNSRIGCGTFLPQLAW